jgi:hypothetical protein
VPDRHDLHKRALGIDKSHLSFSNADFDKVLGVFRSYSQAENLNAQVRQERMPRTRLEHKIKIEQVKLLSIVLSKTLKPEHAAFYANNLEMAGAHCFEHDLEAALNYVEPVARVFGGPDLSLISDVPEQRGASARALWKSDLECLRDSLDDRIGKLRNKRGGADRGWSWHDLKTAAGVECDCAQCRKNGREKPQRAQREAVAV